MYMYTTLLQIWHENHLSIKSPLQVFLTTYAIDIATVYASRWDRKYPFVMMSIYLFLSITIFESWEVGVYVFVRKVSYQELVFVHVSVTITTTKSGRKVLVTSQKLSGVLNHGKIDCLFDSLVMITGEKKIKLRINGSLWGEPPMAGGFPYTRGKHVCIMRS